LPQNRIKTYAPKNTLGISRALCRIAIMQTVIQRLFAPDRQAMSLNPGIHRVLADGDYGVLWGSDV
jgi:hypothetical protein